MHGLVYYPFHFVEKNNPEYARKNCKVLQVVRREGEFSIIYYPHGICLRGLYR